MDTTTLPTVAERVALGVQALTEAGRTLAEVDLESFDIRYPARCVLGQVFGGYDAGQDILGAPEYAWSPDGNNAREQWSQERGFVWPFDQRADARALQLEWQRVIAAAQGVAVPDRAFPVQPGGCDCDACQGLTGE